MTRAVVLQPNYVPWIGYFDLMNAADVFVLLDTVQYTRGDWRNRNRIKTGGGLKWLTIPMRPRIGTLIRDARCENLEWREEHLARLEAAYRDAPAFDAMMPRIRAWYAAVPGTRLVDIDEHLVRCAAEALGIETPIRRASELADADDPTGRLVALCRAVGADRYLSGPAARDYLDVEAMQAAGITVEWACYDYAGAYPQPHPPFERAVSVLDPLLCLGEDATGELLTRSDPARFVRAA